MRVDDRLMELQNKISGRYKILASPKTNLEGKYGGPEATLDYSNLLTRALLDKSLLESIEKILNILKMVKTDNTGKPTRLADSLKATLKNMASEGKYSSEFIKRFIEVLKSTLTLKSQAKDTLDRLPANADRQELHEARELMSKLESYEHLNKLYGERGFLFFPILNLNNLSKDILVFLYFEEKGKERKAKKSFSFLVFVTTDTLKELRLWGKLHNKKLYLEIDTTDSATKRYIEGSAGKLNDALNEIGYSLDELNVRVSKNEKYPLSGEKVEVVI